MVVVRLRGGLGNQLFQYSAGYALAKRLKQSLILDIDFFKDQSLRKYKLSYLNLDENILYMGRDKYGLYKILKNKYINKALRTLNLNKIKFDKNTIYLLDSGNALLSDFFDIKDLTVFLDGYYQSEKYFLGCRNELLRQFIPVYALSEENKGLFYRVESTTSIAVHVRRGDFLKVRDALHYVLDEKYYIRAMDYINNHINNPMYYWFSDDIEWVKSKFGKKNNFQYISIDSENADIDELMLMKKCKHIITANSSFSWWAGWLNTDPLAIRIVPEKRYGNIDMIPEKWIKL